MAKKTSKAEKVDARKDEIAPPRPTKRLSEADANARLLVLRATMEKKFGKGIIQNLGAQVSNQRFAYQVPTDSVSLDGALGPVMRNFGSRPQEARRRVGDETMPVCPHELHYEAPGPIPEQPGGHADGHFGCLQGNRIVGQVVTSADVMKNEVKLEIHGTPHNYAGCRRLVRRRLRWCVRWGCWGGEGDG